MTNAEFMEKLKELNIPDKLSTCRNLSKVFGINHSTISRLQNFPEESVPKYLQRQIVLLSTIEEKSRDYFISNRIELSEGFHKNIDAEQFVLLIDYLKSLGLAKASCLNILGINNSTLVNIKQKKRIRPIHYFNFEVMTFLDKKMLIKYLISNGFIDCDHNIVNEVIR